jgi:peptidoglycan/xylan/chitin deacetylase (PgdA/CDA1 family)
MRDRRRKAEIWFACGVLAIAMSISLFSGTGYVSAKKKPMIALTFDDGPGPYTKRLVKALDKYHAKATFFVVGSRIEDNKKVLKYTARHGHQIGNHTWNHPKLTLYGSQTIFNQLDRTNRKIKQVTGEYPHVMRPPYGSYNDMVRQQAKMPVILWNVDTLDWKHRNPKMTQQYIWNGAKSGAIILMHDIHEPTVKAVEQILPKLTKKYRLVTLDKLAKAKKKKLQKGKIYYNITS